MDRSGETILRLRSENADLQRKLDALSLKAQETHEALGSMLESYGLCIGQTPGSRTLLPPLAVDVVRGFFVDVKRCILIYVKHKDKKDQV